MKLLEWTFVSIDGGESDGIFSTQQKCIKIKFKKKEKERRIEGENDDVRGKREKKKDVCLVFKGWGTHLDGRLWEEKDTCITVPNPSRESETARVKVVSLFKRAEEKVRYSIKLFFFFFSSKLFKF